MDRLTYAQVGGVPFQLGGNCPDGWIVMQAQRPDDDYVAQADGTWAPRVVSRAEVEALRLTAYADPLNGSDRYFAEAQRESLLGHTETAEAAKAQGLARFAEIQAQYPWPEEPSAPDTTAESADTP
ncbi:hypothetical protein [Pseudomonas quasicaspiana]|uniref:hypothetical protein n=1 Tax=Pseudomonas quasicaspiana TaxID=2829821 RepID=UPI001E5A25B8|nr:hypothetical protein [Pseudomonas quasicaspiana]MCD5980524.1 hypothetical protein [Pseudomonas quasicaspiana]